MVGRKDIEVFDFDIDRTPHVNAAIVIAKIKQIQPSLIMFFDEFSQWNVTMLHAIRKDKEITERSYQIISYPTMSLVFSNFSGPKEKKW